MPAFRPPPLPSDRRGAASALANALADQRVPSTARELIADVGGTRRAAELMGCSMRTAQRRAAGDGAGLSVSERRALAQAGAAARVSRVVDELGGVRRAAELTGRSPSTVRRWMTGKIHTPKPDARRVIGRADAAIRMRGKGLQVDPATGQPTRPTKMQMKADVRVRGTSKSAVFDAYGKNIGAWGGVEIDPETIAAVVEELGRGDQAAAQEILEEFLSTNYAECGGYDPETGVGFFIDRIESVEFTQD